ncbi:YheC/YheD family protein [Cohnella hongkongensis]|uniref:YheC/YheD family protein n=1 Tax=Cohnella hongkongensis TaxID=178337 RepID=A0ABV9FGV9_9BACL
MPATFPVFKTVFAPSSPIELGVLVCERQGLPPFAESRYLRRLCLIAARLGMPLFAFAPWTWNSQDDSVRGWVWNERRSEWAPERRKLPSVVYDRAWPESEQERRRYRQALQAIQSAKRLVFLNGSLPHKGAVYEALAKDRTLAGILPPTAPYRGASSLASWLREHRGAAFLKPVAGSQGKRVMAILRQQGGTVTLSGRDDRNRPLRRSGVSETEALRKVDRWIAGRAYLMQPMLDLRTCAGEPFDVRALMQKNRRGRWTLTGAAARVGSPSSVTANLHGGGIAIAADKTLVSQFGERRGKELLEEIAKRSSAIVSLLEQTFGRFAEIGLDYGIERSGKLWFLEANSKPGRAAMGSAGQEAFFAAAEQPLSYAKSILLRLATTDARRSPQGSGCASPGRVIHEFDHL